MLICILTKNVITSCSVTMLLFLLLEVKPLMTLINVRYLACALVAVFFFFQAEDGIRDLTVTGVQTCALPIYCDRPGSASSAAADAARAASARTLQPLPPLELVPRRRAGREARPAYARATDRDRKSVV